MWCADKMPSFGDKFVPKDEGLIEVEKKKDGTPKKGNIPDVKANIEKNAGEAKKAVDKAMGDNIAVTQMAAARQKLLDVYYKP